MLTDTGELKVVPKNGLAITCEAQINVNSSSNHRPSQKLAINLAQSILIQPLQSTASLEPTRDSLDLCMRRSNAGIQAIEFSFSLTLQLSTSA